VTATATRPSQCDRVLEVLKRGGPRTIQEIHRDAGTMRLNSRISELRERGYNIPPAERVRVGGKATWAYRLLSSEDASSTEGSMAASSVESEAGVDKPVVTSHAAHHGDLVRPPSLPFDRALSEEDESAQRALPTTVGPLVSQSSSSESASSEPPPHGPLTPGPGGSVSSVAGPPSDADSAPPEQRASKAVPATDNVVSLDGKRVEKWEAQLIEEERREDARADLETDLARLQRERARLLDPDPVLAVPDDRGVDEPGSRAWTLARFCGEACDFDEFQVCGVWSVGDDEREQTWPAHEECFKQALRPESRVFAGEPS
jgi:Helix-turn-helix domain